MSGPGGVRKPGTQCDPRGDHAASQRHNLQREPGGDRITRLEYMTSLVALDCHSSIPIIHASHQPGVQSISEQHHADGATGRGLSKQTIQQSPLTTYYDIYNEKHTHTHTHTQFIPPGGPNPKGQLSCNLLIHNLKWILVS